MAKAGSAWRPVWVVLTGAVLALPADGSDPPVELPGPDARPFDPLRRPIESPPAEEPDGPPPEVPWVQTPVDPPLGFTGPSSILPRETPGDPHFIPVEDRWRIGFPEWERYGKGHPKVDDYPYKEGHWWDPYNQNVLKGDYPIIGQHTFLNVTATSLSLIDTRQVPTATTPFESTIRPFEEEFLGRPGQFFYTQFFTVALDLFHGDAAFKPVDWRVKLAPVYNVNSLNVNELAIVNPDVLDGLYRPRTFVTLQEWFVETKLADLGPDYDFVSLRAGSQFYNHDFRGFLFFDTNRGVRLFGTLNSNRDQFNLVWFDQMEKDTNSELNNLWNDRHQNIYLANFFHQDFIWPGYTAQVSLAYNRDQPSFKFNKNNFLVRPDPVGIFQPHQLDIFYLGWAGDGHINRFNVTHQFYWAFGHDSFNPLANSPQDVNAYFAAVELSVDRDWARFRTSFLYASGDGDIDNGHACGFDTIFDNPNFAGGDFSYWQRQAVQLFGVNLVNARSIVPDLRSSKIQGQSNFVNPGLYLVNGGIDMDLTPKLKVINNVNFLWFDKTNVLEQFVFQSQVERFVGVDYSTGVEYRPFLNNNVVAILGVSTLFPGAGFHDLYNNLLEKVDPLVAAFGQLALTY